MPASRSSFYARPESPRCFNETPRFGGPNRVRHKNKHIRYFVVLLFVCSAVSSRGRKKVRLHTHPTHKRVRAQNAKRRKARSMEWSRPARNLQLSKAKKSRRRFIFLLTFRAERQLESTTAWVDGLELEELLLHHPRVNLHKFELVKRSCSCFC